jgi:hypothetical protein
MTLNLISSQDSQGSFLLSYYTYHDRIRIILAIVEGPLCNLRKISKSAVSRYALDSAGSLLPPT